jgi:hypothetical protein
VHNGEAHDAELLLEKCSRNCCRKKNSMMIEDKQPYCLELALYESTGIKTRLKFCTFKEEKFDG